MVIPEQQKMMQRGIPDLPKERTDYVTDWQKKIKFARDQVWKNRFKQMRKNQKFVRGKQWSDSEADERYICNIVQRHLQKRTSSLYAKNPRAIAKRRKRLEFQIWDEKPESLQLAQQLSEDPVMAMLLEDVHQGMLRRAQFDGIAKTLELLYDYYIHEGRPPFKQTAKQLVRRTLTNGVGYIKIAFQRDMQPSPDQATRVNDFMARLQELEMLAADMADDEIEEGSKEMERLRLAMESVMREEQMIVREGLMLDFPKSTAIIPDPNTRQLRGFVGADWIAEEYYFTQDQIKKTFNVDISSEYHGYTADKKGNPMAAMTAKAGDKGLACVWELYDLVNGNVLYLCDGYKALLKEDVTPPLIFEQGHPYHVLTFNDLEDDENIFPPSDTELMWHQQMEYNRSREALREHRVAARPAWISPKGMWDEADQFKLGNHLAHELLQLKIPVSANLDINKLLISKPTATIDPNVYDVEYLFTDVLRSTGDHEATFGGSSGDTATEVSVAEASRVSSIESNIDDMDDFLTGVARDCGQILLLNMSIDQVRKIVGPGAVWPEFSAQEAADEIVLAIQAGSSGRPNKSMDLANMDRMLPHLIQIPGINPHWLARQALERMDDKMDLADAFAEGMPSILALNAMSKIQQKAAEMQPTNADGSARSGDNQPNNQGAQGVNNEEDPQQTAPAGQPMYPT